MKTLVKFEFLKILRRKSTWIIMAVSLLVTIFLFGLLPVMQFQTYNSSGVIRGLDGIAYKKAEISKTSGTLTDEYVTETIRQYQTLFQDPENVGYDGTEQYLIGDAYWDFEAYRSSLLSLIASNYDEPGTSSGYNNSLPTMDVSGGTDFYNQRSEKIQKLLDDPSNEMTQAQKNYWQSMNRQVKTPFEYAYYEGWSTLISCFELFMFPLLAICIVIAPVFASEYQAGTDAMLLSGKYGKTRLVRAKILASLLFGMAAFVIHILAAYAIPLSAFGIDGWDLPVQITNTVIPYPLTFLQAVLVQTGVLFLVLMALIGLTLFLSARMKSPYLVLTVIIPVMFIPMFLTPNGTTGIYNQILLLLPYQAAIPRWSNYISYTFGNIVFDVFSMRALFYAAAALVLILWSGRGFRRHQAA